MGADQDYIIGGWDGMTKTKALIGDAGATFTVRSPPYVFNTRSSWHWVVLGQALTIPGIYNILCKAY